MSRKSHSLNPCRLSRAKFLATALPAKHPTPPRFEQLFHGLPVACFCCDTEGQIVEWNHGSEILFGLSFGQVMLRLIWKTLGRPVDSEIIRALFQDVLSGQVYEGVELSARASDGGARHLLCSAFPLRHSAGLVYGCVCTCVDITERIRAEQALLQSEERWQIALRGNNDGIWDWNLRTQEIFVSPRWQEIQGNDAEIAPRLPLFGQAIPEDFVQSWFASAHPDDQPAAVHAFRDHLRQAGPFYAAEYRVRSQDGGDRWVLDRGQALCDRNGTIVRVAGSVTDITDRKRLEEETKETNRRLEEANQKLAALATQDGLTGLKNHRAFQERLATEVERAHRHNLPLSLVLLDVDHFKQYNDTFGHPAGDAVLREVAQMLENCRRPEDLAARYGGEEFVLLLPHCTAAQAAGIAERCRATLLAAVWPMRPVTASFGVAALSAEMSITGDLVTAADQSLYAAKREGRNRVAVAGSF